MVKVNDLLSLRFRKSPEKMSKMNNLAELSTSGHLSSFSGVFRVTPLTDTEESLLRNLLEGYRGELEDISDDLKHLAALTSEVKAINNQAAILHGERIKRAQEILKKYRDGAFSSWLMDTYGNRQTPYNFLQYYELYTSLSKHLQDKVEAMPRQAVYTLATRDCPQESKEELIKNYNGETKRQLLNLIRERFPLEDQDKRASSLSEQMIAELHRLEKLMSSSRFKPSSEQRKRMIEVLQSIQSKL
ncbi:MAG: CT583 family protein [Verrucomicrobia bacterium]|nr:CT583 family protein [Verrucomicrobiota bacterium]